MNAKDKINKLLKEVAVTEEHTEYKISMTIKKSSVVRLYRGVFMSPWRSKKALRDYFLKHLMEELKEYIK